jgi:acyl transferase domain-containing protein
MQSLPIGEGIMISMMHSSDDVLQAIDTLKLQQQVSIASYNGPSNLVLSGSVFGVNKIIEKLSITRKVQLDVSHAFHSPLMKKIVPEFRNFIETLQFIPTQHNIPVISTVTGEIICPEELSQATHWSDQICAPVKFSQAMNSLVSFKSGLSTLSKLVIIEIGPNPVLSRMSKSWLNSNNFSNNNNNSDRNKELIWIASLNKRENINDVNCLDNAIKTTKGYIQSSSVINILDRTFPNRKSYPWQDRPHPLIQNILDLKNDRGIEYSAVIHSKLRKIFSLAGNNDEKLRFPDSGFIEMAIASSFSYFKQLSSGNYKSNI